MGDSWYSSFVLKSEVAVETGLTVETHSVLYTTSDANDKRPWRGGERRYLAVDSSLSTADGRPSSN